MTLAQDITRHFGGDWHGSYGSFPAPGHSASDRGVTVKDNGDGDVLFNTFNDADWRQLKDQCRAAGLLPERSRGADDAPRETGHYEYADADGSVLYRTVRIEQVGKRKRFQAQRPDGRGGWINGMADVQRVLYRLPEISRAIGTASIKDQALPTVYLVEGERKADKLASWGLLTTAVAFGCKGWRRDYAETLAGCTVIIIPDNDDEGMAFAAKASADLQSVGAMAHIIELPGLPPKGDIIDWKGGRADLEKVVASAIDKPATTFPLADLSLWSSMRASPKPFILPGFVPAQEVTLLTGKGGTNKSTYGQQLATCTAAAVAMLGIEPRQCVSLYLTAEDDEDRLQWMQEHICAALGVAMAQLAGKLFLSSLRGRLGNELGTFDGEGRLRASPAFATLKATIEQTKARLVVLDNAAHLFAGNENDRGQVTAFINMLYSLCRDLGVTIVLVAHTNKAGDSWSGSTAWLNAVRSQIVIERPEGSADPDERVLTVGKANYARPDQELRFRWHDFALIRDEDLSIDTRAELAAVVASTGDNAIFLACLEARTRDGLVVSPNVSPNYAPTQFEAMPSARGIGKVRLRQAMERLLATGEIEVYDHENKGKARSVKALRKASRTFPDGFPNVSRTVPAPPPERRPNAARTTPHTHSSPIGEEGAAHEAAAPSREQHKSRVVFAANGSTQSTMAPPADDEIDTNPGWNDEPYRGRPS